MDVFWVIQSEEESVKIIFVNFLKEENKQNCTVYIFSVLLVMNESSSKLRCEMKASSSTIENNGIYRTIHQRSKKEQVYIHLS